MIPGTVRRYSELIRLTTFEKRFGYLSLGGIVGDDTFGFDRYINQKFYRSAEWKRVRDIVISRDNGCDLGIPGREIYGKILIHHMNPIAVADIHGGGEFLLDPEYLICVSHETHNAIHYGDGSICRKDILRYQNPDGTLTPEGKKRKTHAEAQETKKNDSRHRGGLTTAELEKKIKRLQLDKQLRELTDSEVSPGKAYAQSILKDVGKKVITTAAAGAALYGIKAAASKSFNLKDMGNAMFNGGAKKK